MSHNQDFKITHLQQLADIAVAAGDAIMTLFGGDFELKLKGDQSPVTEADLISQRIIEDGLSVFDYDYPTISEESPITDFDVRRTWEKVWIIDPLDGTSSFIKKSPSFTINIGLVQNENPVFGLIYSPYQAQGSIGDHKLGLFRFEKTSPVVSTPKPHARLENKRNILVSYHETFQQIQPIIDTWQQAHIPLQITRVSSAIKFLMLAQGQANCYLRSNRIQEWDIAAGHAIVEAAGYQMRSLSNKKIKYNQQSLLVPEFMITPKNPSEAT